VKWSQLSIEDQKKDREQINAIVLALLDIGRGITDDIDARMNDPSLLSRDNHCFISYSYARKTK